MHVRVAFPGLSHRGAPAGELPVDLAPGATVAGLLEAAADRYAPSLRDWALGPGGQPRPGLAILVNGRNAALDAGPDTLLKDGDFVAVVPVILGG